MPLTKPRAYQIYDIDYKQSVRVVTISNVTLSGGAPNAVDGVNLSLNDRILVTGQTNPVQNGIYYVTALGAGSNGTWARSIDTDTTGELEGGTIVMVTEGAIYADTQWKLTTNDPITIGVTALTFVQNYLANSISFGQTSFAIGSSNANATVSVGGTSNVAVFSTAGANIAGTISASGNITSAANVSGGNILTVGQISATGTITTAAGTNSTGFAVGNGAVSNVGLGFFPTAGTRGDYAIRDYSSVFSTMYLDVGIGGSAGGEFQLRSSNAFSLLMRANSAGIITPGRVFGLELNSTQSSGDEGGQINLALAATNTTLSTSVIIDVFQNRLRFFEGGGTARGAYIDLTACSAGAGTNLLAGGGGGTPGGANTQVQFNDGGAFGGNGQFTYNKVTNTLTAGIIAANNNGAGTNFQVGDDAWIGDINLADTMSVRGQQNAANGYIVFGNANGAQLGRAGTGPLTYAGAFSASGNVTGGNILTGGIISATGNVSGGNVAAATTIFSLGTVGASGNVSGGNLTTVGQVSATGAITGAAISGTTISGSGNVTGGNLITGGLISATGAITGAAISGTAISGSGNVTGGNINTAGLVSATGNVNGGNINVTGDILDTGPLRIITAASGAISLAPNASNVVVVSTTGAAVTGTMSASGTVTGAGVVSTSTITTAGNITTSGANGVANIGAIGAFFNTVHARATSAQYADVAEYYASDRNYEPGTVVIFGGDAEVTLADQIADDRVAGVVSTNPAYIMNAGIQSEYSVPVALTGRVPTRVLGPVNKGSMMISAGNGYARACSSPTIGTVIGKSLENFSGAEGIIEIVVGRM